MFCSRWLSWPVARSDSIDASCWCHSSKEVVSSLPSCAQASSGTKSSSPRSAGGRREPRSKDQSPLPARRRSWRRCRASGRLCADGAAGGRRFSPRRRLQVIVEQLRLGCAATPFGQPENAPDPNVIALRKGQDIARLYFHVRLCRHFAVHPQLSRPGQFGRRRPGPASPGMPQPLVQPHGRRTRSLLFRQLECLSAVFRPRSCAKGDSDSARFSLPRRDGLLAPARLALLRF